MSTGDIPMSTGDIPMSTTIFFVDFEISTKLIPMSTSKFGLKKKIDKIDSNVNRYICFIKNEY